MTLISRKFLMNRNRCIVVSNCLLSQLSWCGINGSCSVEAPSGSESHLNSRGSTRADRHGLKNVPGAFRQEQHK